MATVQKVFTTLSNSNVANGLLRLTFSVTQNVVLNRSTVSLLSVEFQSSTQTGTCYLDGIIKINNVEQVRYSNSGTAADKCVVSALNTYYTCGSSPLSPTSITVQHDDSGNGSFSLYIGPRSTTGYNDFNVFNVSVTSGSAHVAGQTVSVDLPQIMDTLAVATPTAPINTVEDGSADVIFTWSVSNDSGLPQTASELQWKDGDTWTTLATISGTTTTYTLPEGTLSAGTIYWRVRAYNRDNVAGSWSSSVSFVLVTAPGAPGVECDNAPFATITWRSSGQQAFRITVDDTVYGPFFGTSKSFTLRDYLADGEHSVAIEIQGNYGLWSQPGTLDFTVENVPGDEVALSASFGIDAALSWVTDSAVEDFLIYRDGVQIGHTDGDSFVDRLSLGKHAFAVVNRLADGNYTISNVVTGVTWVKGVAIAAFSGGGWMHLPLSDKSDREQAYTASRNYSLRHVSGARLPFLEISPYEDSGGSYDCAFLCADQAGPLLALLGKQVIVKARGKNVIVGPFASVEKRQGDFYVSLSFSVPAAHYEDYVDEAN